jgi:hypothetical protein
MKFSAVRVAVWTLVGFVCLGLFLPLIASGGLLLWSVVFGWVAFLQRVWPSVTVNWNGIGMVTLCSALILAGLHSMGKWLFGALASRLASSNGLQWRLSWTFALYLVVWLLFAAVMGAVGVAHQVGWLIRSGEPLMKPRRSAALWKYQLREKAMNLAVCAHDANWNLETTRRSFYDAEADLPNRHPNVFEDLHVVFLGGTSNELAAGLIFHRDRELQAKAGFAFVSPEFTGEILPMDKLAATLSRYQSATNSLSAVAIRP